VIARMTGTIQPYAWGSPTFIPTLLGTEPTGAPQAELWLGAHHSAPSLVGDRPLDELISADATGVVGAAPVAEFGAQLPFLMKVLAAAQPLSLQAHPSRAQAEAGFARENEAGVARDAKDRLYKDDWPKPEALCALMDSEALCGFRDPEDTYELFDRLGSGDAMELVAPLADSSVPAADRVGRVFSAILRLQPDELGVVDEVVAAAEDVSDVSGDDAFATFAQTARELGDAYPRDPGVLAALLMNRIALRPNDAVFLPAGNLHAYLHGGGVEIMANSDNVLRGGLTPKHVDVNELLSILDFTPGFAGLVPQVEVSPGVFRYDTPAPEFALWRIELTPPPEPVEGLEGLELPGSDLGRVMLVTNGQVTVTSASGELGLERGQSAFATAGEAVRVRGLGTLFVGGPGSPAPRACRRALSSARRSRSLSKGR